jgi:hypothetical protein
MKFIILSIFFSFISSHSIALAEKVTCKPAKGEVTCFYREGPAFPTSGCKDDGLGGGYFVFECSKNCLVDAQPSIPCKKPCVMENKLSDPTNGGSMVVTCKPGPLLQGKSLQYNDKAACERQRALANGASACQFSANSVCPNAKKEPRNCVAPVAAIVDNFTGPTLY